MTLSRAPKRKEAAVASDATLNSLHQQLGEITGTLRELNHATNNNSSKIDSLTIAVATQAELVRRVDKLDEGQRDIHLKLAVLEADKHRREGAIGLVAWLSRHWPFTLLALVLGALVAWANGKLVG
jgi:hypothetical protein